MDSQKKMGPSGKSSNTPVPSDQGTATLIVMIAVLLIIVLFCCFSAPGIRGLCKRYIFRTCDIDDPDLDNVYTRRYGYDTRDEINEVSELKKQLAESQKRRPQQ
ncbi:uncharacterized protein isoform X2 [Leptinotarsa decemlineata]|uniref:uncharacterized protein isoform X2 n=1 Tax=Leptinotarsa decemlineata TaxID=7539 RepID=UPI000C254964|nr:uncharacterized protein LOC111504989 [Leptinotarsa decemlineata]